MRPPSADAQTYTEAATPRSRENQPTGDRDGAGAGATGFRGSGAPLLDARAPGAPPLAVGSPPGAGGRAPDAASYDPAADDDTRLETAIARRNLTWADFEAAAQILRVAEQAGREEATLQPLRGNYNRTLDAWEWAIRELVRERRRVQLARMGAAS